MPLASPQSLTGGAGGSLGTGLGGGVRPKAAPPLGPLPDTAFGRVCEAFSRSIKYLPGEVQGKLDTLLEPKTVFTFVALLAGLAAVSLTPLGPFADVVATAYGAYQLGSDFAQLITAVQEAAGATSTEALEVAAQHVARGLNDSVIDTLVAVAGSFGFSKLRSALEPLAARFMPARFLRSTGRPPLDEPGNTEKPGRSEETSKNRPDEEPSPKDKIQGGLEVVGAEHLAPKLPPLFNGAAVAKGAAAVAGVALGGYLLYRLTRRKRTVRSSDGF